MPNERQMRLLWRLHGPPLVLTWEPAVQPGDAFEAQRDEKALRKLAQRGFVKAANDDWVLAPEGLRFIEHYMSRFGPRYPPEVEEMRKRSRRWSA
jgi:hypothetical protein